MDHPAGHNHSGRTHRANATAAALSLAACTLLAGCWSYRPGDPARLASPAVSSIAQEAWPARDANAIKHLRDITPDTAPAEDLIGLRSGTSSEDDSVVGSGGKQPVVLHVEHNQIHGQGLLRLFHAQCADAPRAQEYRDAMCEEVGFVATGRFLTSRVLDDPRMQMEIDRKARLADAVKRLETAAKDKGGTLRAVTSIDPSLLQYGMSVSMPGVFERPPKGLIIHLHSLAPNPFEPKVDRLFTERGWAVVTLNTSTGIRPPFTPEQVERIREIEDERTSLLTSQFDRAAAIIESWKPSQVRSFTMKDPTVKQKSEALGKQLDKVMKDVCYRVDTEAQIDSVATTIARETDEALASNAYAVEAVLDYINAQRGDISPKANHIPVVLAGFSAGALAAPAAAVRVKDALSAVVLIGGGADLFRISQESTLTDGGIKLRRGSKRAPLAVREKVDAAYLQHVRLDPYHTAPLLAGLPVLQVHADWDGWVPNETGDMLWERLGRPDRMILQGGHSALFFLLPGHAEAICDWIERAVGTRSADSKQ